MGIILDLASGWVQVGSTTGLGKKRIILNRFVSELDQLCFESS